MRSKAVLLVVLLAGLSCRDVVGPEIDEFRLPDIREMVAGAARDALDSSGRFVPSEPWSPSDEPIIGAEFAQAIGHVFLRDFIVNSTGPIFCVGGDFECRSIRENIEASWCRSIDWDKVRLADHWFYGVPPTGVPAEILPQPMINDWGPKYFLPVLHGSDWIFTIAVAAHATNVSIRDGRIHRDGPIVGAEFATARGNCSIGAGTPPAAEEAVAYAAARTGRRIIQVPTLTTRGVRYGVGGARWRVVLEAPVTVRTIGNGSLEVTDVLYVSVWPEATDIGAGGGPGLRLSIPAPDQPDYEVLQMPQGEEMLFARRAGVPLQLIEVTVVDGTE